MQLIETRKCLNQYLTTICVSLLGVGYGTAVGWASPSIPILLAGETGNNLEPVSQEIASWISSSSNIGGLIGCFTLGYLCRQFGCKFTGYVACVPLIASWLLIVMSNNAYYIITARILAGFSGSGAYAIVPTFVAEMSEDRIRGTLSSFLVFAINTGILMAYISGYLVSYKTMCWILFSVPILFLVGWYAVPETPAFLIRKDKLELAKKSLCFYRNTSSSEQNLVNIEIEFSKLKESLNKSDNKTKNDSSNITCAELATNPTRKALIIGVSLICLYHFCGLFSMLNYTATIFEESGSDLSPNASAIIVAVILILGSFVSLYLVDRAGRRILLITSAAGIGVGQAIMGVHSYLKFLGYNVDGFGWIPLVCFSGIIFAGSFGVLTLPFVVHSEIMPEKIRAAASSFCMALLWILTFLFVKYFTALSNAMGMHGLLLLFSSCSFAGMIFVIFFVPETKGKSFDEILKSLM